MGPWRMIPVARVQASAVVARPFRQLSDRTVNRREDIISLQNRLTPWGDIVALSERIGA